MRKRGLKAAALTTYLSLAADSRCSDAEFAAAAAGIPENHRPTDLRRLKEIIVELDIQRGAGSFAPPRAAAEPEIRRSRVSVAAVGLHSRTHAKSIAPR